MVYDDLMIRNNTVPCYNTNRSQPVTVQYIKTADRTLISVRIIVPFFRMASSPVSLSIQLILELYMI